MILEDTRDLKELQSAETPGIIIALEVVLGLALLALLGAIGLSFHAQATLHWSRACPQSPSTTSPSSVLGFDNDGMISQRTENLPNTTHNPTLKASDVLGQSVHMRDQPAALAVTAHSPSATPLASSLASVIGHLRIITNPGEEFESKRAILMTSAECLAQLSPAETVLSIESSGTAWRASAKHPSAADSASSTPRSVGRAVFDPRVVRSGLRSRADEDRDRTASQLSTLGVPVNHAILSQSALHAPSTPVDSASTSTTGRQEPPELSTPSLPSRSRLGLGCGVAHNSGDVSTCILPSRGDTRAVHDANQKPISPSCYQTNPMLFRTAPARVGGRLQDEAVQAGASRPPICPRGRLHRLQRGNSLLPSTTGRVLAERRATAGATVTVTQAREGHQLDWSTNPMLVSAHTRRG